MSRHVGWVLVPEDSVDHAKLRHHGDVDARPGMLDFAVNVQGSAPPDWLRLRLAARLDSLGRYPSAAEDLAARSAIAARHGRSPDEVLLLAGAAEGFAMLPRLAPRLAAVIHPSFTEPEVALREAGIPVHRVLLGPPYTLTSAPASDVVGGDVPDAVGLVALDGHEGVVQDGVGRVARDAVGLVVPDGADRVVPDGAGGGMPDAVGRMAPDVACGELPGAVGRLVPVAVCLEMSAVADQGSPDVADQLVPAAADLVVLGNPTNPTSVLHPAEAILALRRPGRVIVVDEAFADAVPGEPESLAGFASPDVLVLRSLTKTWALAGLRCGYFLGAPELLARLNHGRQHWPLGSLQLEAIAATAKSDAVAEAQERAQVIAAERESMIERLAALGVQVHTPASGPFLLLRVPDGELLRKHLADKGIAVRRADTFPGLGPNHLRVAVRGAAEVDRLVAGIRAAGL
jgi:histidinol-phosphate aminotransferase